MAYTITEGQAGAHGPAASGDFLKAPMVSIGHAGTQSHVEKEMVLKHIPFVNVCTESFSIEVCSMRKYSQDRKFNS